MVQPGTSNPSALAAALPAAGGSTISEVGIIDPACNLIGTAIVADAPCLQPRLSPCPKRRLPNDSRH